MIDLSKSLTCVVTGAAIAGGIATGNGVPLTAHVMTFDHGAGFGNTYSLSTWDLLDEKKLQLHVQRRNNINRLNQMAELPEDWNGYGGRPIAGEAIEIARNIVWMVNKQPEIFPTGRGTVQLQYERQDKSYLEFEVYPDKIVMLEVPKREYIHSIEKVFVLSDSQKVVDIISQKVSLFWGV